MIGLRSSAPAVAVSDFSAASTRGRRSWRGRPPRGDGAFGMAPGYRESPSSASLRLAITPPYQGGAGVPTSTSVARAASVASTP